MRRPRLTKKVAKWLIAGSCHLSGDADFIEEDQENARDYMLFVPICQTSLIGMKPNRGGVMAVNFETNDGGRLLYFKGEAGDCVTRAVTIASGLDYKEVYDTLAEGNASQRKSKRSKNEPAARGMA